MLQPSNAFADNVRSRLDRFSAVQVDCFSYGVVLWEIITKEQTQRGNWRKVRVPEECPQQVEELLQASLSPAILPPLPCHGHSQWGSWESWPRRCIAGRLCNVLSPSPRLVIVRSRLTAFAPPAWLGACHGRQFLCVQVDGSLKTCQCSRAYG